MIPRTLVPTDVRPLAKDNGAPKVTPRRLSTYMDDRTVVPHELSDTAPPLTGNSAVPSHVPREVLIDRTLVPRGLEPKPLENIRPLSEYAPIAILDSRVVVPAYVEPAAPEEIKEFEHTPQLTPALREVVEPDIFITGDPNLLIEPEVKRDPRKDAIARAVSLAVHIGLIVFIIFLPQIFPTHVPTKQEIELARQQLVWTNLAPYRPEPRPGPPPGPKPNVAINNKVLNKVAPPRPESHAVEIPPPAPTPRPDLPSAPVPRVPVNPTPQPEQPVASAPQPSRLEPIHPAPAQPGHLNLQIPNASPGKALQDQLSDAVSHAQGGSYSSQSSIPRGPGSGGGGGGGQGGGAFLGNQVEILTPTEGVDFSSYMQRLLASVKRNWYAVIPESARMGDKGIVVITFHINKDGTVPMPDPNLERTSGKPPLDIAAMSAIRASSPFEPLPAQFNGPYIELRFIFLYNLRVEDYVNR
jgi:TonB family protein